MMYSVRIENKQDFPMVLREVMYLVKHVLVSNLVSNIMREILLNTNQWEFARAFS